jgi:lipopolysaccharide/colanic/teichoic acid biosynthesis glycosyltransferase
LAPVAVVIALGELHAHLIGHYAFTGTSRFSWTIAYIVLLELGAYVMGLLEVPRTTLGAFLSALGATVSAAVVISLIQLVSGSLLLPREVVLGSALLLTGIYGLLALAAERIRQKGTGEDRVLAVIGPDEGAALDADLLSGPERSAHLIGVVSPAQAAQTGRPLLARAEHERVSVLVLGREAQTDEAIVAQAAVLHGRGTRIRTLTLFYDEWLGKLPLSELEPVSLMFDIQELHAPRYARLKRIFDLVAGAIGVVALAATIPPIWVLDQFANRGPLFFRQDRVGKGGREFTILKFRTMGPDTPSGEWTEDDDPRIPPFGRWLRRTHLDELPQAVNVLRGELSLVGPRPEQPRYVAELEDKIPFYELRHLVQPGVTGWAQVKFPYGASVDDALEKLQYEFFYLRHQGPVLDARILARTLRSVLRHEGR